MNPNNEDSKVEIINNFLIKTFIKSLRSYLKDPDIKITKYGEEGIINPLFPELIYQFFYNSDTNRCYIEYKFSNSFKKTYRITNIKYYINNYIDANFKYELEIYPEVIFIEDDVHESIDSSIIITPYTIGYWKSLSGIYTFIEDSVYTQEDINKISLPTYPKEYKDKCEELYNLYYKNDFDTFDKEMYKLNTEYKINQNKEPDHTFKEFIDLVKELAEKYKPTKLSEEDMQKYHKEYIDIYKEYKDDQETFKIKLKELNEKYNIETSLNKKIPEIFEEYKALYKSFYDRELPGELISYKHTIEIRRGN